MLSDRGALNVLELWLGRIGGLAGLANVGGRHLAYAG